MPKPASDDAFFQALVGEDALGAVVRAHIHIEARLQLVLEALTPKPDHLPNLRFEQRVKLAVALGFDEAFLRPLISLGHIRNSFGHRLDVTLTDDTVNQLFADFADKDKATMVEAHKMTSENLKLNWPEFGKTSARHKFVSIATALDKVLTDAEEQAKRRRNA